MRFERYLKHLEARLEVPYPERHELLLELRDHLESLHGAYRSTGLSEPEAADRAIRTLAADESFMEAIDGVHAPAVRRALARLPTPVSLVVEHTGIGLLAAGALAAVISKEEAMIEFFASGGFFMIPLNLMGLAILVLAGERIFSLYLKRDHAPANLGRRLLSLRFLGQACALTGVIGTLLGYFQAFGAAERVTARHGGIFPIWEVSRIALTTTIWGLTLALVALVTHYVVRAKAARIESQRLA